MLLRKRAQKSVEAIKNIGVNVYGDLDALAVRIPSASSNVAATDELPVDAAVCGARCCH